MNDTIYERELTHGRSTLRFSVWTDDAGDVCARLVMEPSEGRLHPLSIDVDPVLLDAVANMALDCANAYDEAVARQEERAA